MFSKAFGYALRGVTYVALYGREGRRLSLLEISEGIKVPHYFLGKIMQDLVRHQVIDSMKGPNGGFFINDRTPEITLMEILLIVDGKALFSHCALGIKHCNAEAPCPLHHEFAIARDQLLSMVNTKTIGNMAAEVERGESLLCRPESLKKY